MKTKAAKDGHTLRENAGTQPLVRHPVFNNPEALPEGWYPLCKSRALKRGEARSFLIGYQRLVAFRGEDGTVRALDAFCPHMGADLGNGRVVGNELQCYFHQWRFDGEGRLTGVRVGKPPPRPVCLASYPVEEKYGFLWVFSGESASYGVTSCPGLEDTPVDARYLGAVRLYAHHHVMMAGGIDLQHFATVHQLDVDFQLEVDRRGQEVADWRLRGALPKTGWRARLGRWLLGSAVGYSVRFGGGSVAGITYGPEQRFRGTGRQLPPLHLLWGCVPLQEGVSLVHVFALTRRREGLFGRLASLGLFALTILLLALLKDDDVKAFPHMRFNPVYLTPADASVSSFIRFVNSLPLSRWSRERSGRTAAARADSHESAR